MKVLLAGGTGMIGKELGKALCSKGYEITVVSRNPKKTAMICPYPHESVSWNELESNETLNDIDHIINLAGAGLADRRWNSEYKQTIVNSRLESTSKLVSLAKKIKAKSIISTSGVGFYGDSNGEILTEDSSQGSGFLAELCKDWEEPLKNTADVRAVILRVAVVLSEKGGALDKMVPPIQMGFGGPLGNGQQFMSWIDVDDLVNMYIFSIENDIEGTFNACAPDLVTNKELTNIIARRLSKSAFMPVPYFALRTVVGEMAYHLIENQKVSSQKIQDQGFKFQYPTAIESVKKRVPKLASTEKRYIYEQWVPQTKEEIFPFFADAKNLEKITPEILHFKVLNSSTETIQKDTEINYKLKINGVPVRWKTLIKGWNPPHQFVDNQEKGPYKKWHHTHSFEDLGGGTLMTDQVDFIIPLGLLGYGMTSWKVEGDIQNIFNYRRDVIHDIYFNKN